MRLIVFGFNLKKKLVIDSKSFLYHQKSETEEKDRHEHKIQQEMGTNLR